MLVDVLLDSYPRRAISSDTPPAASAEDERVLWKADLASLLRRGRELEHVTMIASTTVAEPFGYVGHGRH
jgi:hypothetical protein